MACRPSHPRIATSCSRLFPDDGNRDNVLTVSGAHREETEEKKEHYVRRERRYGSFSRSMMLPKGVTAEDVEATTEDGVLEVVIPVPKAAEKKNVEVKPKSA